VIPVAIVDDQPSSALGRPGIISPADGIEVVAECEGGHDAVEQLADMPRTSC
jgi:hypothetical protein